MEVNPINNKRIYQSIIEQIINMIIEGEVQVGEKLPAERALAKMFNVSRASVREAFRAMEIVGVIEVRPGGGSFIRNLNIVNFINTIAPLFLKNESMENDLLEFRKMIEVEAVRLAAEKSTLNSLMPLGYAINLMRKSIENKDANLGSSADIEFHKAVFGLSDNHILIKASEFVAFFLESSVKFNRQKILKSIDNSKVLFNQHVEIYEAIKDNNPKSAVLVTEKHLNFINEIL